MSSATGVTTVETIQTNQLNVHVSETKEQLDFKRFFFFTLQFQMFFSFLLTFSNTTNPIGFVCFPKLLPFHRSVSYFLLSFRLHLFLLIFLRFISVPFAALHQSQMRAKC